MKRTSAFLLTVIATAASLAIAGCGTTVAGKTTARTTTAETTTARTAPVSRFAGYKWQVISITHDGKRTPIPARYDVYLSFARSGQFGANDPVNYHSGTYRTTGDGFTSSQLIVSAAGSAGDDPVTLLAIDAIHAFDNGVSATAMASGDGLAVTAGGYQFGCQRDGTA